MLRTILASLLFSLTACYASTVTMFFTGMPYSNENGTYNGFAIGTVNGTPNQLLICDDYNDTTYVPSPSTMIYDYSTINGADPLGYAMFNHANYDEAAVLVYQLSQIKDASPDVVTDYQYALWNLMTPSVPLVSGRVAQEQALQTTALAMVNSSIDAQFLANTVYAYTDVYTPTAPFKGNQEFLEYYAPEPNLALPLGFLLILVAVGMKVRQNRQRLRL
jgi:hypothetical protein